MNAPGTRATQRYVRESLGLTFTYARLGATSAAWKSIECGIGALLTRVKSTVSPTVTRSAGPGMSPPKVQASNATPSVRTTRAGVVPAPIGASPWDISEGECAGAWAAGADAGAPAGALQAASRTSGRS